MSSAGRRREKDRERAVSVVVYKKDITILKCQPKDTVCTIHSADFAQVAVMQIAVHKATEISIIC